MWLNSLFTHSSWQDSDLIARTSDLATRLQGVRSVALWFNDTTWFTAALLAAWQVGAKVFLLPNQTTAALEWSEQAEIMLSDTPVPHTKNNLIVSNNTHFRQPEHSNFVLNIAATAELFLQTSGSTGTPKVIRKTCAQMCAEATAIAATLPENWHNLTVLHSVSPQHLYGLTFGVFTALKMGWKTDREMLRYPEDFMAKSDKPCVWLTSPTVLTHFGAHNDFAIWREQLNGIISAGGSLPESTRQLFAEKANISIFDVYGSTETGVIARRFQTTTHILFDGVIAHMEESLNIQSLWTDGIQTMADVAQIEGNALILQGRSDRIIKLADKRISLQQLEHDLLSHPYIADAHCVLHKGRVAAWVALNTDGIALLRQSGRGALLKKLRQSLVSKIEKVALPRYWRLTANTLPRNPQGKILASDVQNILQHPIIAPNWQLQSQSENEAVFSGCVPVDLLYFSGHFANFPLVAGVVQVQWAMTLAQQFAWGHHPVLQMENLKYQQFIRPNDEVTLSLKWDRDKGKLYFSLMVNEKMCTSGRAVLNISG